MYYFFLFRSSLLWSFLISNFLFDCSLIELMPSSVQHAKHFLLWKVVTTPLLYMMTPPRLVLEEVGLMGQVCLEGLVEGMMERMHDVFSLSFSSPQYFFVFGLFDVFSRPFWLYISTTSQLLVWPRGRQLCCASYLFLRISSFATSALFARSLVVLFIPPMIFVQIS